MHGIQSYLQLCADLKAIVYIDMYQLINFLNTSVMLILQYIKDSLLPNWHNVKYIATSWSYAFYHLAAFLTVL